jgi:hypothetical protein
VVFLVAACTPVQLPVIEIAPATGTAPSPVVVAPAVAPPPEVTATVGKNPFVTGQEWRGVYVCAQGETDLFLQIRRVQGDFVRAVFAFFHDGSGASGAYEVAGQWDARTSQLVLTPGEWLRKPSGYVSVGLSGKVTSDVYEGKVDHATCGTFSVRLLPDREEEEDY